MPPYGLRFFFSSRRRHTRCSRDWSSDVCSSDLLTWQDTAEDEETGLHDRVNATSHPCVTCYFMRVDHIETKLLRSEERRVGKECRSRRWSHHEQKKNILLNLKNVIVVYSSKQDK